MKREREKKKKTSKKARTRGVKKNEILGLRLKGRKTILRGEERWERRGEEGRRKEVRKEKQLN